MSCCSDNTIRNSHAHLKTLTGCTLCYKEISYSYKVFKKKKMLKEKFLSYNIMPRVFTENIVKPECQSHPKTNKTRLLRFKLPKFDFSSTKRKLITVNEPVQNNQLVCVNWLIRLVNLYCKTLYENTHVNTWPS